MKYVSPVPKGLISVFYKSIVPEQLSIHMFMSFFSAGRLPSVFT